MAFSGLTYAAALGRCVEKEVMQAFNTSGEIQETGLFARTLRFVSLVMFYGGIMGSYGVWGGNVDPGSDALQMFYSSVKVPLLIGITFLLGLPSLFVFYALAGLADEFRRVLSILLGTQMIFAIVLVSLSPFVLLVYVSTNVYVHGVLANAVAFGVAAIVWQSMLRRRFRMLIAINRRHRMLLVLWFVLYVFIGVQAGWTLRPFIGNPGAEVEFFRSDGWGNAWIEVWDILMAGLRALF